MTQFKPLRRSKLVTPWGVGAIVNFPDSESLMTCGLDAWPFALEECLPEMKVIEERLQQRLGINHFRLPPEFKEPGPGVEHARLKVPFIRFPCWHYCPRCGAMEELSIYGNKQKCKGPELPQMSCHTLLEKKRPILIPVRFICVCGRGHIQDFPFMAWVHQDKPVQTDCQLRLRAGRSASSLSGISINCTCGAWRTMAGAFNEGSLRVISINCSGQRPWLGEIGDKTRPCGADLRVVQRGASNVYYANIYSSIYLPKWSKDEDRKLIDVWENNREYLLRTRVDGELNRSWFELIALKYKVDVEKLLKVAQAALDVISGVSDINQDEDEESEEKYRKAEYDAILSGAGGDNQEFFVVRKRIDEYGPIIQKYLKSISLIHKLRETRALVGFSRLLPEDGRMLREKKADMALSRKINWLPAIVVKGEGVFFEFEADKLEVWLQNKEVVQRTTSLITSLNRARSLRGLPELERDRSFARFILLHTFAHILVNQFSFECGYGSSSLRERLYCNVESDYSMNGVLIYTASGDSEGSLGGLVRQGNPGNLENIVTAALYAAQWCSSDPVCMESQGQGPDSCNLAACHSCCLLPETSCEKGNRLLDRALIVGTLDKPDIGYFSGFELVGE